MQFEWLGKNVDLDLLCKHIECFFETKGFKIHTEKNINEWVVVGVKVESNFMRRTITVKVKGDPLDFVVDFIPLERYKLSIFELLANWIGLGALTLRRLKNAEFYQKLEEEFWVYLDEKIPNLFNSSKSKMRDMK